MNEFDFQSGEFLDTLYTGSIYSDDSSITTESSTNPVTTNVGNYGTNVPYVFCVKLLLKINGITITFLNLTLI